MPAPRKQPAARVIGQRLKALRDSLGLTQATVGEALGMTEQGYAAWERGYANITVTMLHQLARALGVSVDQLTAALVQSDPPASTRVGSYRLVPLAQVRVSAGDEVWRNTGDAVTLDERDARGHDLVAMIVVGDCMAPDVQPGDVVLVDRSKTRPAPGDLVVVASEDGPLLKRYDVENGEPVLRDNRGRTYRPDGGRLVGVVFEVRRRL